MEEKNYCYLADAIGVDEFEPKTYTNVGSETLIIYKEYKDPDEHSKKLYNDLMEIWNKKSLIKFERAKDKKGQEINELCEKGKKENRFSSDYIGPSRAWAKWLIPDIEIGNYLKVTRTLGGHVLWPKHKIPTINTARGGVNGFFDRIDFTLAEIKNYYDGKEEFFSKSFRKVLEKEKEFLDKFTGFKEFVDYWKLNPFIGEGEYNVVSLVNSNLEKGIKKLLTPKEPLFPGDEKQQITKSNSLDILINKNRDFEYAKKLQKAYRNYIANNTFAIKERNELIFNKKFYEIN